MKLIPELSKEKIVWGAWVVKDEDLATDERAQWIKDLGLDFIYFGMDGWRSKPDIPLDMCAKHDLGVLAFDSRVENMPMDRFWNLADQVRPYASHPALVGNVIRDEPGVYDLPRCALLAKTYTEATGKTAVINLFPSYANELQFNYVDFPEYIDQCARILKLPYLSYDHYPLYGPNGRTWVQEHYLYDFEVVAEACRRYGLDMWYFIQTLGFNKIVREPNEQDMRWQVYCALSFGAKVIQLFTYNSPGDANGDTETETFQLALVDREGNKTVRYDMMQRVIREADAFGSRYVTYRPQGVMLDLGDFVQQDDPEEIEITFPGKVIRRRVRNNYLELFHALDSFDPVVSIKGDHPVLAGCFDREDGAKAFTLVNASDPGLRTDNRAAVTFRHPVRLRVWTYGQPSELDAADRFEFHLDCGQGLFVEIIE